MIKKIPNKILYSLLALAVIFSLSSYIVPKFNLARSQNSQPNKPEQLKKVKTETLVNYRVLKETISYPGIVSNLQDVKLIAKTNGTATKLNFEVGDRVAVGKLLATIEDIGTGASVSGGIKNDQITQAGLAVEQANESLDLSEESYDNLKDSSKKDLKLLKIALDQAKKGGNTDQIKIAKNQLESAEEKNDSQLEAAKTQIEIAELQLETASLSYNTLRDNHRVTAPFSGTITQKLIEDGESVSVGQVLGNISQIENAKIRFFVDKEELARISKGQGINIAYNDKDYPGEIITVTPKADIETKRFLIEAKPTEDFFLPAETVVSISFEIEKTAEEENTYIIPISAITIGQNENYLFAATDNIAKKTLVKIVKVDGRYAYVEVGLPEDAKIIYEGNKLVADNEKFEIIQ